MGSHVEGQVAVRDEYVLFDLGYTIQISSSLQEWRPLVLEIKVAMQTSDTVDAQTVVEPRGLWGRMVEKTRAGRNRLAVSSRPELRN